MPRYAALIRAVNVGGRNKLPMTTLREVLAGLGFTDVTTLLQSGNAVFTAPRRAPDRHAADIEAALRTGADLDVRVLVRSQAELAAIVEGDPFIDVATDPSRYLISFLSAEPDPERFAAISPPAGVPDRVVLRGRELYLWCPGTFTQSPLPKLYTEKRLGVVATARNRATVGKLLELM